MDIQKKRESFQEWFKTTWNGIDLCQTIGELETFQLDGNSKYFEDCVQNSWEAWQQAQKVAIPEGFVLVPREPTPKMIDSTWDYDEDIREMSSNTRNEFIYKTMIKEGEIK